MNAHPIMFAKRKSELVTAIHVKLVDQIRSEYKYLSHSRKEDN